MNRIDDDSPARPQTFPRHLTPLGRLAPLGSPPRGWIDRPGRAGRLPGRVTPADV